MTRIVEIPNALDDRTFESFAESLQADKADLPRPLFDARPVQWASPFGLVGLLTAGQWWQEQRRERPLFTVPAQDDVTRYWARTGFFREAEELFEIHGKVPKVKVEDQSDVLLGVTAIRNTEDVHQVVGMIQERASRMLTEKLGLAASSAMGFSVSLSEACQNIVEHAGTGGWVAVHAYNYRRRLGRRVVVIAVSDGGVGFRRSLEGEQARRYGERWGDGAALEAAVIHNVSRFRDPGRGQGLAGIKRYLARWEGKLSIRSGTARIAIVPAWDEDVPLADHLAYFPGSQVQVTIPASPTAE
ncbi:MAG TPA: ATP-binding protein [Gemmatimonadales bacterium]|nr:ATP-binding protein [Gemmatimonadales bacterium]